MTWISPDEVICQFVHESNQLQKHYLDMAKLEATPFHDVCCRQGNTDSMHIYHSRSHSAASQKVIFSAVWDANQTSISRELAGWIESSPTLSLYSYLVRPAMVVQEIFKTSDWLSLLLLKLPKSRFGASFTSIFLGATYTLPDCTRNLANIQ